MQQNLKNLKKEIADFFNETPNSNQRAWEIVHNFYHIVLSYMEEKAITKADLARRLGKSRAAITQLFNNTPNISIKKMTEIADSIGLELKIELSRPGEYIQKVSKKNIECIIIQNNPKEFDEWINSENHIQNIIFPQNKYVDLPFTANEYTVH